MPALSKQLPESLGMGNKNNSLLRNTIRCLGFCTLAPVAVAWACALSAEFESSGEVQRVVSEGKSIPAVWVLRDFGSEMLLSEYRAGLAAMMLDLQICTIEPSRWDWSVLRSEGILNSRVHIEQASGFPLPCLKWQYKADRLHGAASFGGPRVLSYDPAWNLELSQIGHYIIPLSPVWKGLLGNVVIYGFVWVFLIHFVPYSCRNIASRMRNEHGLCQRCAYNLCGNPELGCPECGWGRCDSSE